MGEAASAKGRIKGVLARVRRAPGSAHRRHLEVVRRDDVEHHLLTTLHGMLADVGARLVLLEAQLDRVAAAQNDIAAIAADAVRLTHATQTTQATQAAVADIASDVTSLAIQMAALGAPEHDDGPLVSIVMPTWQRASLISEAVRSVLFQTYERWELLVVDDGSDDGTAGAVAPFLTDDRIRFLPGPHAGVSATRNRGLEAAQGELVAYLDSDNTWHPTHLSRLVQALDTQADAEWAFSGQALFDGRDGRAHLRKDLRSTDSLAQVNFVDLNALAHRRSALERTGRFDTTLTRLTDWDLVLRLAELGPPARTWATTVAYRVDAPNRISNIQPMFVQQHLVRSRHRGRPAEGLRILFAEWHYLQLTETYIAALTQALADLGAEVQIWASTDPTVPSPTPFVVHRGTLEDAITEVRPDLVVTNWLNKGTEFRPVTRAAGLPHIVRAHGFDHDIEATRNLLADDGVLVHTFPHLVDPSVAGHPRLVTEVSGFDEALYRPAATKDRHLVVRTTAGLYTKDLDTFLLAAALCPEHHFVLVIGRSLLVEERTAVIVERARELGSPCEIRIDVLQTEVAELVTRAGIYLHTHGTEHAVGMPISIVESMATGAYVLARDLPGTAAYVGGAGRLYSGTTVAERAEAAAELIRASSAWSDDEWTEVHRRATEHAYRLHAGRDVAERMLRSWQVVFPQLRRH